MRCGLIAWLITAIAASGSVADERPPDVVHVAPLVPVGNKPLPKSDSAQPQDKAAVAPLLPGMPATNSPAASNPANGLPDCPDVACENTVEQRLGWINSGPLLYWLSDAPIPTPLVATGPLGNGSQILIGDQSLRYGTFAGFFIDGGWWCGDDRRVGFELAGFLTQKQTATRQVASNAIGNPVLARPFFNPQIGLSGGQDAFLVSSPGQFAGLLTVETGARIDGAQMNILLNLLRTPSWSVDGVAGARYFDLDEYLTVSQYTQTLSGNNIPYFGTGPGVPAVIITDRIRTRNQFWGGQMGLDCEYRYNMLFVDGGARVGLGPVHQVTEVSGQTVAAGATGGPGGILAVGQIPNGNIGRTTTDRFSVLADAHGMIGVQLGKRARLGIGYQFLYLNNVARPGDQVVTSIDPRLVPISAAYGTRIPTNAPGGPGTPPVTPLNRGDVVAHGVRFSIVFMY